MTEAGGTMGYVRSGTPQVTNQLNSVTVRKREIHNGKPRALRQRHAAPLRHGRRLKHSLDPRL